MLGFGLLVAGPSLVASEELSLDMALCVAMCMCEKERLWNSRESEERVTAKPV